MQTNSASTQISRSEKLSLSILRAFRLAPYLLGAEILVTLVLALVPVDSVLLTVRLWDKAQHAAVFAVLAITASVAYPNQRSFSYAGLLAFGALIEITQAGLTTTRSGELLDVLADGIGIVLGSFLYWLLQRYLPGVAETSREALPSS